jgi:putative copper resistance protein D
MMFAFALVRALHLASLMILFGSAVLLLRLRARVPELALESRGLRRLRLAGAALALLSALAWLCFAAGQMAGDAKAMLDPGTLRLTLGSTLFGQMLMARLIVLVLLGGAVLARREAFIVLLSGLGLGLISVTSHAAEASPANFAAIGVGTDGLHLLCGGIWLGGLCVLAAIMAQRRQAPRLTLALTVFAGWGMAAVALLAMTGLINAATIVLGGPGHAARLYLGVLGAKLVLVLAMTLLALNNHFRLLPRLQRPEAAAALKGNIIWELGLGLAVVLLAGLLGLLAPTL